MVAEGVIILPFAISLECSRAAGRTAPTPTHLEVPESGVAADDVACFPVLLGLGFFVECFGEEANAPLHVDIGVADAVDHRPPILGLEHLEHKV